jgi:hypothetical protein
VYRQLRRWMEDELGMQFGKQDDASSEPIDPTAPAGD